MKKVAFAVAAHPDDIEMMMAGTLLLLGEMGYELHVMNVANGSCGTARLAAEEIVAIRTSEARSAAQREGAIFHGPLVDDLMVYYTPQLVAKLCAIVRQVRPQILLLPSPQDYMEDHTNVSRLMVTAAFCRGMRNFATDPPSEPVEGEMAVYHTMPWGMTDQLRNAVEADLYVDISTVIDAKREALACHVSQKEWLDESQGLNSYLKTMEDVSADVGRMSGQFEYAEGWRWHLHAGFAAKGFDPLAEALSGRIVLRR